ncbi:unnamed protein product, partial [Hymenolepis diminuta]
FPKILPSATVIQTINDETKLYPSSIDSVKVTGLMHSMENLLPKVATARLVSDLAKILSA